MVRMEGGLGVGGMSKEKGLGFYFLALFNYIISLAEFYGASLE